jgi:hypothetical protein
MFIPDPNFFIPDPASKRFRIHIKEFKYFLLKKLFLGSRKYDRDVRIPILIFSPIPDPGVKNAPDPNPQHLFMYTLVMHSCIIFNIFLVFFAQFLLFFRSGDALVSERSEGCCHKGGDA